MTRYTITENQLKEMETCYDIYEEYRHKIATTVRSHPYRSTSEQEIREQVLNEAIALFDNGKYYGSYDGKTIRKMLAELKVQR